MKGLDLHKIGTNSINGANTAGLFTPKPAPKFVP